MNEFYQEYIGMDATEAHQKLQNDHRLGFRSVRKVAEGVPYTDGIFEIVLIRFDPKTNKVTRVGAAYKLR